MTAARMRVSSVMINIRKTVLQGAVMIASIFSPIRISCKAISATTTIFLLFSIKMMQISSWITAE
jgi:hypothetical protein